MNESTRLAGKVGFVICTAFLATLTGCTTYVAQPSPGVYYRGDPHPREVYVPPPVAYVPPPAIEVEASVGFGIRVESDFYEPLTPYGRWEIVGSHGRCWIPARVETNWRPYSNGRWQRTDAGWYWASDEPWAWATYHYGRWDFTAQFGWYWVPQTQWSPAWVSWHEGGGYVGWAPLPPSARFSGGAVEVNVALIAPQAFVFVEPRRFLEPVRPTTVVVNNTTIINKTVNITNIKVVNNTVINEGPRTQIIEQASGQQVRAVPVRELRRKQEAEVATRQRTASPGREKNESNVQTPVRSEAARETNRQPESERRAKQTEVSAQEQSQPSAKDAETATQVESQQRAKEAGAKAQEEAQRNSRGLEKKAQQESEQRAKSAEASAREQSQRSAKVAENTIQAESQRRAKEAGAKAQAEARSKGKETEKIAQPETQQRGKELGEKAQAGSEKKTQGKPELRPKREQVASEPNGTNTVKKAQKQKGKRKPSPPEDPPVTPPASP
jgi:hypothetical protein